MTTQPSLDRPEEVFVHDRTDGTVHLLALAPDLAACGRWIVMPDVGVTMLELSCVACFRLRMAPSSNDG
jgi:hypothetical protein